VVSGEVRLRPAREQVKILNVNALLDPVTGGGTAERTVQMSRALRDAGVECSIVTTDVGLTKVQPSSLDGIHISAYRCLFKRFYFPLVRYAQLRKEVESVDVVHLMGHWTVLNALMYLVARAARKPYVVCPAGALRIYGRSRMLKKVYNWFVGRRIIRNASAWVAITGDECAQFEAYGVERDKVVVIPNGINPADFHGEDAVGFREKHGIGSWPFILFVGRLNIIKGPDILLEAFCRGQHRWPDWHLVFAGPDGGLLTVLKNRTAVCTARDRIHFIGYVGGTEKSSAYRAADLLAIPSRQEAMSIVVLESSISGTPVLLTDQCGFDEVGGIGGGKVVPATVEGLLAGLNEMLSDRAKLVTMGSRLMNYVHGNYTWDVVVQKYLGLYDRLLAKNLVQCEKNSSSLRRNVEA
jgi:glycosyltransferase involved in cell wall biosynthesis